jgi:hypothetical protein
VAISKPLKNQKELLLDSTRPIGKTLNTDTGRPKSTSAGVLLQCHEATQPRWHVLRATYARELKVQTALQEKGIRTFIPMMWSAPSSPTRSGIPRKLVPAVSGLVFALATREALDLYIRSFGDARPVNYYWDRTTNAPLTVPAKAMEDFITIASTLDEDLIYLTEISEKLREGQTVMVKDGPFKGVEGKIVRIRKSRRVLVELPGMLAVASTYVDPKELEII